ncbi:MAG: ArsC family protein [Idiomarinaceae bacterium HL-53]|nr:MAG: ArsC family protein [Idiomarinaceae bacterium HL-53]CUS49226.1 transcriptional regulator, Spx/MgsR family [Idiomarinaceae bacterium HL-53]
MNRLFGIPNCDTVKKARKWLESKAVDFTFHDYRQTPVPATTLEAWLDQVGVETLLNTRSTTWRNLPDADKQELTPARTIHLLQSNPTLIKRPVLVHERGIEVGFKEARYAELFA